MSVINKLVSSLGRNDDIPNQELAALIAQTEDKKAVEELVAHLTFRDKDIQSDCIKVLYETGNITPSLIAPHAAEILKLLSSKNNRMIWGAMAALNTVVLEVPEDIYNNLEAMMRAADTGSVIAKDNLVNILIKLASISQYKEYAVDLLLEQLWQSAPNQLPMYAERSFVVLSQEHKEQFGTLLKTRLDDLEKETQKKRVEKILKKLGK